VTRVYVERDARRLSRDDADRDIRQLRDAYRRQVGEEIQARLEEIRQTEYELEYLVAKLRLHFLSWREIAEFLGVSPQLAHYRFRHVTRESRSAMPEEH
jgi:AraC-like DNA-binding protein